jgi:hypothetical protein
MVAWTRASMLAWAAFKVGGQRLCGLVQAMSKSRDSVHLVREVRVVDLPENLPAVLHDRTLVGL